jgi:hypothetical protein
VPKTCIACIGEKDNGGKRARKTGHLHAEDLNLSHVSHPATKSTQNESKVLT